MSKNQSDSKTQLIEFLKNNYYHGYNWNTKVFKEQFGVNGEQARSIWKEYRRKNNLYDNKIFEKIDHFEKFDTREQVKENKVTESIEDLKTGKKEITISGPNEINSLDDLLKFVDISKWSVIKYTQNFNGKIHTIKAWLEPTEIKNEVAIEEILKNYKSNYVPLKVNEVLVNKNWSDPKMLVINLNDLHFDKLDLENSTIDKRIDDYNECLKDLVLKSYVSFNIDKIVFVIGNDIFNTDNIHNTTTNGTPQSVNSTWDIAYERVFECMVKSISFLKQFCNQLDILLIPGNHDRTKSFYLVHGLEAYFRSETSIVFSRNSYLKKIVVYGNQFIGFNHGDNKNDKLPLAFATEFYEDWGKCKYHDLLVSDKHHNNEKVFKSNQTQNEFQGVKVRILPSLSGTDRWHNDNLYNSRQSGVALIYDQKRGKIAEFEYQL